jgi:mono/diheme cytochrome c family protein
MRRTGSLARVAPAAVAIAAWLAPTAAAPESPGPPDTGPARRVALPGSAGHGRDLFAARGCVACHAATFAQEAQDGLLRSGHPLEGAAHRGTWWNGRITTDAGEAADFCLRTFIDPNSEGFTAEERKALVLFMQELGSERGVSPLVLLRRDAGDVELSSGDVLRGQEVWRRACASCHPDTAGGARVLLRDLSAAQLAEVVRKGNGTMPFFQVDRLPAPHVADVVAYLDSLRRSPVSP